jgi:maleate isomerase
LKQKQKIDDGTRQRQPDTCTTNTDGRYQAPIGRLIIQSVDMEPSQEFHRRIGVVLPSVNTVVEEWFPRVVPCGVSIHVSRVPISSAATPAAVEEMARHEKAAIELAADCAPDVIIHGCVAASIVRGAERDRAFALQTAHEIGIRFCTAMAAILMAFESLGVHRICIASPYTEALDAMERRFLEESGIEVTGTTSLGIGDTRAISRQSAGDILALGRRAWIPGSDALLVSCLALRSHRVAEALEHELQAPVITATQAALWAALRLAGIQDRIAGCGRLLA